MDDTRAELQRRSFLRGIGAVALGGVVFRVFGGPGAAATNVPFGDPLPAGTPTLVLIDLNGGNDDLNTLVPIGDPWYYDAGYGHGSIALAPASTRALGGLPGYGLHPSLAWLANRWNTQHDVAFVLGTGQNETREFSHFVSEDNWRTCVIDRIEPTGFLGRYNDLARPGSPLASISLSGLHPSLVGNQVHVLGVPSVADFGIPCSWQWTSDPVYWDAFETMADPNLAGNLAAAAEMITQTLDAEAVIGPAANTALNAGLDWGSLPWQMAQAAMMINAGVPCQTYVGMLGGFDTHDNQLTNQATKLSQVDGALNLLFSSLSAERRNDVCVLIRSEFGRQVTVNGSGGTDHGQASTDILVGPPVTGGLYGEAPTLDPGGPSRPNRYWDARKPTVDFRTVFSSVLDWLGQDRGISEEVLGRDFEDLMMLRGGPPPALRMRFAPRRRSAGLP